MNKKKLNEERELAEWLIDQYIAWRTGVLKDLKLRLLDSGLPGWNNIASSQIISRQINRIIHENHDESIKNDLPVPFDNIVLTVLDQLKSDIREYGHGGVAQ